MWGQAQTAHPDFQKVLSSGQGAGMRPLFGCPHLLLSWENSDVRTGEQPPSGNPDKWPIGQKILGKGYIICIWRSRKKQVYAFQSGLSSSLAYLVKLCLCLRHGYRI